MPTAASNLEWTTSFEWYKVGENLRPHTKKASCVEKILDYTILDTIVCTIGGRGNR